MRIIGPHRKSGRKMNPTKKAIMERFDLTNNKAHKLNQESRNQLCLCKDDSARRLLLGKSEKVAQ